jgi:hypothetical protein
VIANIPPHWKEGTEEEDGSRWVGQVRGRMTERRKKSRSKMKKKKLRLCCN